MIEALVRVSIFLALASIFALSAISASPDGRAFPRWDASAALCVLSIAPFSALPSQGDIFAGLPAIIALACAAICASTDVQCGYVFDRVTISGVTLSVLCAIAAGRGSDALAGACCASGTLLLLWGLSRRRGIGLGDVKLAAVIGAATGPLVGFAALGAAFVLGAGVACAGLATRKLHRGASLRFAPYLASSLAFTVAIKAFVA